MSDDEIVRVLGPNNVPSCSRLNYEADFLIAKERNFEEQKYSMMEKTMVMRELSNMIEPTACMLRRLKAADDM